MPENERADTVKKLEHAQKAVEFRKRFMTGIRMANGKTSELDVCEHRGVVTIRKQNILESECVEMRKGV